MAVAALELGRLLHLVSGPLLLLGSCADAPL